LGPAPVVCELFAEAPKPVPLASEGTPYQEAGFLIPRSFQKAHEIHLHYNFSLLMTSTYLIELLHHRCQDVSRGAPIAWRSIQLGYKVRCGGEV